MDTQFRDILFLLKKFAAGNASATELDQLLAALQTGLYDELVAGFIVSELEAPGLADDMELLFWRHRLSGGAQKITRPPARVLPLLKRWWVAASVLLLVGAGLYWLMQDRLIAPPWTTMDAQVLPGRQGAVLILADGSEILLDTLQSGTVALQGGVQAKVLNGVLVYEGGGSETVYNTMRTPKGQQFQVTLPDGTRAWLNSASAIRYPTRFAGTVRRVEITGEAYFEVKKDHKPFIVSAAGKVEIEVLGTHFNVNSYANEPSLNTTLLEGSVRVSSETHSVVIRPGEQAQVHKDILVEKHADLEKVMAWKNGLFNFEDAGLREVMKQLERWYDIEVVYEGEVPDVIFGGMMSKKLTLNELLDMLKALEGNDLDFRLGKGRTLVVSRARHP